MNNLILVRHGQSEWNYSNRFTGWQDISLTNQGRLEAKQSGNLIKQLGKYSAVVRLHRDVTFDLPFEVVAEKK